MGEMEKMRFLPAVKIRFSYSKARNRYGSPSLKEANMFDHVREE